MGLLICKLSLITIVAFGAFYCTMIVARKSYIVNRQLGVEDMKYLVVSDTPPTGHVTQRMRYGHSGLENGLSTITVDNTRENNDRQLIFSALLDPGK